MMDGDSFIIICRDLILMNRIRNVQKKVWRGSPKITPPTIITITVLRVTCSKPQNLNFQNEEGKENKVD